MQHPCFNFLCFAYIPEIFAQVTAGSAGYVHFCMVFVVASRTFPLVAFIDNNFPVKSANLAIVALGVELSVLNVVVNKPNYVLNGLGVMAHVGNFHI